MATTTPTVTTAPPRSAGRVTRLGDPRRRPDRSAPVARAQAASRRLRTTEGRFAHLKRMYD